MLNSDLKQNTKIKNKKYKSNLTTFIAIVIVLFLSLFIINFIFGLLSLDIKCCTLPQY